MTDKTRRARVTFDCDVEPSGPNSLRILSSPLNMDRDGIWFGCRASVSVEYLTPARTWTDGDVVQFDTTEGVRTVPRKDKVWIWVDRDQQTFAWSDDAIDTDLACAAAHTARVLRYQAGGDE